jgi:hypothetical protein
VNIDAISNVIRYATLWRFCKAARGSYDVGTMVPELDQGLFRRQLAADAQGRFWHMTGIFGIAAIATAIGGYNCRGTERR